LFGNLVGLSVTPVLLDIFLTQIRDTSLQHVKNLTFLHLSFTQVSDAGLEHLKGLTKPTLLLLNDTKVTIAGVAELQKTLPNCNVAWDGAK
jgi:hypothetical protein